MLSRVVITVISAFASLVFGAPVTEGSSSAVEARSGHHRAIIYSGAGCTGDTLDTEIDFGCGGTCHQISNIASVLLVQDGTGNPKPTADFFSDNNCKTSVAHAGIFKGEHSGCTSMPSTANSFYLYNAC